MGLYQVIPECSSSPTWSEVTTIGFMKFQSTSYTRFIAMPEIGVEFTISNQTYVNQHIFKVSYYSDSTSSYWCVIATIPNENTNLYPRLVRSDTDYEAVSAEGNFSNNPNYNGMVYYESAFSTSYILPAGAIVFTSRTDCLDAMNDGKWSPEDFSGGAYSEISDTTTGGNVGDYDFTNTDNIDFPVLPSIAAISAGFISIWSPDDSQLLNLASFMWNAEIATIDFWKKMIANPIDLIYGLNIVPLNLNDYIDDVKDVVVGIINTGIEMNHLSTQWVEFDCGYIDLPETWGAYLDYDPYTKLEIYLPFCGMHPLKADDFIPGRISLKYNIDLLTGSCVAVIKSTKSDTHGDTLDSVLYQFMGNCATQIPVTSAQYADAIRSTITLAASIGTMVATGGVGATVSGVSSAVENVMNLKPSIERSGALGSSSSLLSVRTPYLILTRPRQAKPEDQNIYTGYPSFITETLGDISGWTIVKEIHLDGIPCTKAELEEIDSLLRGGVIL